MAWFGESLSSLKDQITSFTKEVLAEGRQEVNGPEGEELECSHPQGPVSRELWPADDTQGFDKYELSSDDSKQKVSEEIERRNHELHKDNGKEITIKEEARVKKEGNEKADLEVWLNENLQKLEYEKNTVSKTCFKLEKEVESLTEQLSSVTENHNKDAMKLQVLLKELEAKNLELSKLQDANSAGSPPLKDQLKVAERRIHELEEELQRVNQALLSQVSDSQMYTSELREEVEQTRWQLCQDSGLQKAELLRARQDMVNRIIQMGEKNREVELNVKKLQRDEKGCESDIKSIILKLGDPEQQELIQGTLKALELENQVLKLRNAQLESSAGNLHKGTHAKKQLLTAVEDGDLGTDANVFYKLEQEDTKSNIDCDTESLKSEISKLSHHKRRLDEQVSLLQSQTESYEREIEHYKVVKSAWSEEKQNLEKFLKELKDELKVKEEKLNNFTVHKGEVKKQSSGENVENEEIIHLQEKIKEMTQTVSSMKEEIKCMQDEKVALVSEKESLEEQLNERTQSTNILERKIAELEEDNRNLVNNLEELDQQQQVAIDKLLTVKQELHDENESMKCELTELKQMYNDLQIAQEANVNSSKMMVDASVGDQTSFEDMVSELRERFEEETREVILKLVPFELPKKGGKKASKITDIVEGVLKQLNEYKWKKDTLERKVSELAKEIRDLQMALEDSKGENVDLENECSELKEKVQKLVEELMQKEKKREAQPLDTIPEHSEEFEAQEQRILALEAEIRALREARFNLETDAAGLREENHQLIRQLQTSEAKLRNQENMEKEISGWKERCMSVEGSLNEAVKLKCLLEEECKTLKDKIENVSNADSSTNTKGDKVTDYCGKEHLNYDYKDVDEQENINRAIRESQKSALTHDGSVNRCCEELEKQFRDLQAERHRILSVLDEKTRENGHLKTENRRLLQIVSVEKAALSKLQDDNKMLMHQSENTETSHLNKDEYTQLHKTIREKDLEIESLTQKAQSVMTFLRDSTPDVNIQHLLDEKDELLKKLQVVQNERDEVIKSLQLKHQESTQYHNEIQRLNVSLCSEQQKYESLQQQHETLIQVYEDKQKTLLNTQNELIYVKQKADRLGEVQSELEKYKQQGIIHVKESVYIALVEEKENLEKVVKELETSLKNLDEILNKKIMFIHNIENELESKQQTISFLEHQMAELQGRLNKHPNTEGVSLQTGEVCSLLESAMAAPTQDVAQDGSSSKVARDALEQQIHSLQNDNEHLSATIKQQQQTVQYLQSEVNVFREKEGSMHKELERLKHHLLSVEEGYTQEALVQEEKLSDLKNKLSFAEERMRSSSTAYSSASIRANQQVDCLQEQIKLLSAERDHLQKKLSAAEDQVQHHAAALQNLQIVLEQFQKGKEREIHVALEIAKREFVAEQDKNSQLLSEMNSLKGQLQGAQEGLSAAARLSEQLDKKSEIISNLKEEVNKLNEQLRHVDEKMHSTNLSIEGKVDKYLVKNLIVGYFLAPPNNRHEVLRIVATVLDFNQQERERVGLSGPSGGWLRNLMWRGMPQQSSLMQRGIAGASPEQSLSEAFIRFLENESRPKPQLRMLPEPRRKISIESQSSETSARSTPSQEIPRSPLLMTDMVLPTFSPLPVGRNSSSILKDVLKES